MDRKSFVIGLVLSLLTAGSDPATPEPLIRRADQPVAAPPTLPPIGKWMLDATGSPAHWLGQLYLGKNLWEPINVVVVDGKASSLEEARQRLVQAASGAGYRVRMGHSSGYRALIGSQTYPQLPAGWDDAFSDEVFELTNNHGRLFGPHQQGTSYIFVGAFSREQVSLLHWPGHRYSSFNRARDDFAARLDLTSDYKLAGSVEIGNAIVDDARLTTGDHDGKALLLVR
jgi:hypothetical protein